jgi:protein-L-isoaspartate O-methyltransferase
LNTVVLNPEIQKFINLHLDANVHSLLLKGFFFESINSTEIIEQIEAKNKCKNKLPTWHYTENIYYPNKLNIEQTSSEITAQYKSQLISGKTIIDITGGFGVDCYYFSKQFKEVTHCELNEKLSSIVNHNFKQLAVNSIITKNIDGVDYLKKSKVIPLLHYLQQ